VASGSGARSTARSSRGRTSAVLARLRAEPNAPRVFPPEAALVVRCGTLLIKLYRHGRLAVSGSCFVRALQYRDYYFIEYRLNRTWMLLPAGTWIIESLLNDEATAARLDALALRVPASAVGCRAVAAARPSDRRSNARSPSRVTRPWRLLARDHWRLTTYCRLIARHEGDSAQPLFPPRHAIRPRQ
jgi:hypothetical protein